MTAEHIVMAAHYQEIAASQAKLARQWLWLALYYNDPGWRSEAAGYCQQNAAEYASQARYLLNLD